MEAKTRITLPAWFVKPTAVKEAAIWLSVVGCLLVFQNLDCSAAPASPYRVALMDFTSDENSYRSGVAASDFSTALEGYLASESSVQWVERSRIQPAEQELLMSAAGLVGPPSALIQGRWLKADWLVTGRFSRNDNPGHVLSLEIVDVAHADSLAQKEIPFSASANKPFPSVSVEAERVVGEVRELLKQATKSALDRERKSAIALLFCHNAGKESINGKANPFADVFSSALQAALATNSAAYLVRFPHARRGLEENELILAGLVDSDPDAWKHAAENYVWGTCAGRFGTARRSHSVSSEVIFDLTIHVLSKGGELQTVVEKGLKIEDLTEAAVSFSGKTMQLIAQPSAASLEQTPAKEIAASLVRRAQELVAESSSGLYAGNVAGRERFYGFLQVLETARFLDPGNQLAYEELLFAHWGGMIGVLSTNRFRFLWNANAAWGKHFEQFGLATLSSARTNGPLENGDTTISRYVAVRSVLASALLLDEMQLGEKEDRGFPRDVPPAVVRQMTTQIAEDFVKRASAAVKLPEAIPFIHQFLNVGLQKIPDPKLAARFLEDLWPSHTRYLTNRGQSGINSDARRAMTNIFRNIGTPGRERELFALCSPAKASASSQPAAVTLPRASEVILPDFKEVFSLPSFSLLPPRLTPTFEHVAFPATSGVFRVYSMVVSQGKLWMLTRAVQKVILADTARERESGFKPIEVETNRFMLYSPETKAVAPVEGLPTPDPAYSLFAQGDSVWVTGAGVFNLDPTDNKWRHFGNESGLSSEDTYAIASANQGLFAIDRSWCVLSFNPAKGAWTPITACPFRDASVLYKSSNQAFGGSGQRLLYWFGPLGIYQPQSNRWQNLAGAFADSPHFWIGNVNTVLPDDSGGFWFGSKAGLHFVEPASSEVRNWYATRNLRATTNLNQLCGSYLDLSKKLGKLISPVQPTSRISSSVVALTADTRFLFVATADGNLLVYDKAIQKWVSHVNLPWSACAMANSDTWLWVALSASQYSNVKPLLQYRKTDLLSTPSAAWLTERPTEAEISKNIASWRDHEQALYAFLTWDFAKAAELLEGDPFHQSDPGSLLMLGYSYSPYGLNKPDKSRRHFEALLSLVASGSQWAAEARTGLKQLEEK